MSSGDGPPGKVRSGMMSGTDGNTRERGASMRFRAVSGSDGRFNAQFRRRRRTQWRLRGRRMFADVNLGCRARHGRQEFRFDLGDLGLHGLAALDRHLDGDARIGQQRAVECGESRAIDPLAERAVVGVAFFEGVADRLFDRVQIAFLPPGGHKLLMVSRRRAINQRADAAISR